ncbi:hypothetical protein CALCODRAFT_60388 [Calocera cornea HHB12733]|uniref:Dbl homology domain-containing protein n=1 Tax=Calocera cornea HHB12733 TaxID=1353952 RepID=A0A165DP15_9BASI|nr:hypothetical protein CALCODRAFT_60388 [Calocera cornea HHB12733]
MSISEPSSADAAGITFPRSHLRTASYPGDAEDDTLATLRQPSLRPPISFRRLSTASAPSNVPRSAVSSVTSFDDVAAQSQSQSHEPGSSVGSSLSSRPPAATRLLSEQARSSSFSGLSPLSPAIPRSPRRQGPRSRRSSRQQESIDEGHQRRALKRLKVVKELLDTEKSYVAGLDLIYEHFLIPLMESLETSRRPLVTRDDLNAMFSNFIDIWNLHRAILRSLTEAVSPSDPIQPVPPALSYVMRSHFPYLSMYRPFVANFPSAMSTISHLQATSPVFRAWLADREKDPKCGHMTLVAWLLTCVQRVPRYLLLLKDLVACSDPTDDETEQLRRVFVMVSKTAETLDRALAEHSLTLSALALQRACVNLPFPLISPGRRLIKRGALIREGPKSEEPREFLLFTDCILYFSRVADEKWLGARPPLARRRSKSGNDAQIRRMGEEGMAESDKWRYQGKLSLQDVTVVGGGAEEQREDGRRFEILSPQESFAVYAGSKVDCQAWLDAIREAKAIFLSSLQTLSRPLSTLTSSTSTRHLRLALQALPAEPDRQRVDHFVPAVWVPDQKAPACMRCGKPWTVLRWRHHCRLCGSVVCADCSTKTFFVAHSNSQEPPKRPARACNTCYETVFPLIAGRDEDIADGDLSRPPLDHRLSTITVSSTTSVHRPSSESAQAMGISGFHTSEATEIDDGLPELTATLLELGVSPFAGALKRTEVQRLEVTARLSLVEASFGGPPSRSLPIAGRAVKRLSVLLGKGDK